MIVEHFKKLRLLTYHMTPEAGPLRKNIEYYETQSRIANVSKNQFDSAIVNFSYSS